MLFGIFLQFIRMDRGDLAQQIVQFRLLPGRFLLYGFHSFFRFELLCFLFLLLFRVFAFFVLL